MPAPIVLFVYNRPDHTRQTVEGLARNSLVSNSELWIFSDGPKTAADEELVADVRHFVHTLPGAGQFAAVKIRESDQNHGLAQSIIAGVTCVMEARGRAIVLEDDLVTAPDFLAYMNATLDYFAHNPRIGSVTGYSPLLNLPIGYDSDVYVLPRSCSWGWGTWQDRWRQVDWAVADFKRFCRDRLARRKFDECGSDRFDRLFRQMESDIDSWSVRFGYWQFREGLLSVYPAVSRVRNIGRDGSGVHAKSVCAGFNDQIRREPVPFTLSAPVPHADILHQIKILYSGGYLQRFARWLRSGKLRFVERAIKNILLLRNS